MAVIGREHIERTALAAARAGGKLGRLLPAATAPKLVEIALVVLIAFLLAQTVLRLVAPLPRPGAIAPLEGGGPATEGPVGDPFRLAGVEAIAPTAQTAPATEETTLDLVLHGTWVDVNGGTAIIRTPDGVQGRYSVGDPICCGASLAGVYADQVIISRSGVRESLRLANKGDGATRPGPPQTTTGDEGGGDIAQLGAQALGELVAFQPADDDGAGGLRFALHPAADPRAFQALGLRAGDVLLAVNGAPAPTGLDGVADLLSSLQGAELIQLTVERNGAPTVVDIRLASES